MKHLTMATLLGAWLVAASVGCGTDDDGSSAGGSTAAGGSGATGADGGSGGSGAQGGGNVGGSGGVSWSTDDPPVRDETKAAGYCQAALDTFAAVRAIYRDEAAPIGDLNTLYHMERLFHGMTAVWQVQGDDAVVSDLLDISLAVIGAGEDLDSNGTLDYCFRDASGAVTGECDHEPDVMPTYPWRAMRGLARTLRAAAHSSLAASRAADVETLREFVWSDVIDKWLDLDGDGPDEGLRGTDTAGILSRMAGILLDYADATGDETATALASEWTELVASDMEASTAVPGAYWFDNWVGGTTQDTAADTSHSNEIVVALVEGFEDGILPYETIDPLHGTLLDVMWNGDGEAPQFAEYVDGSGGLFPAQVVMGWMRLGQFRGETQSLMAAVQFSESYDLEAIEANGNLCRNAALALTSYP